MKTISLAEFKTHCLRIMDEVRSQQQAALITEKGVAVAKLVPVPQAAKHDVFGCLAGTIEMLGDIEAPLLEWVTDIDAPRLQRENTSGR